jgi:hypothetical protein
LSAKFCFCAVAISAAKSSVERESRSTRIAERRGRRLGSNPSLSGRVLAD